MEFYAEQWPPNFWTVVYVLNEPFFKRAEIVKLLSDYTNLGYNPEIRAVDLLLKMPAGHRFWLFLSPPRRPLQVWWLVSNRVREEVLKPPQPRTDVGTHKMFIKLLEEIAGTPAWGRDVGLDYAVYPALLFVSAGAFFFIYTAGRSCSCGVAVMCCREKKAVGMIHLFQLFRHCNFPSAIQIRRFISAPRAVRDYTGQKWPGWY